MAGRVGRVQNPCGTTKWLQHRIKNLRPPVASQRHAQSTELHILCVQLRSENLARQPAMHIRQAHAPPTAVNGVSVRRE